MDLISFFTVLFGLIVSGAIIITLWHLGEEHRPEKFKSGEIQPIRPRRRGFDQIYFPLDFITVDNKILPVAGTTWDVIGARPYSDGSYDFRLANERKRITVHFVKHQLAPKGGSFLSFFAPSSSRVAIVLDGHIMNDPVLAESVYDGQWNDLLRDHINIVKEAAIYRMKYESLKVNYDDDVIAEVERTTTKAIPTVVKAVMDAVMKHG